MQNCGQLRHGSAEIVGLYLDPPAGAQHLDLAFRRDLLAAGLRVAKRQINGHADLIMRVVRSNKQKLAFRAFDRTALQQLVH
jgi:hypothetical protein